jgi:hypothetical protein
MVLTSLFQGAGALLGGAGFAWTGGYRVVFPIAALCYAVSALVLVRLTVPTADTALAARSASA